MLIACPAASPAGSGLSVNAVHGSIRPPSTRPSTALGSQSARPEAFVVAEQHTRVRFESDGSGSRDVRVTVRLLAEAGVQRWGQLVLGYNAAFERLDTRQVEVRKRDGTVVPIDRHVVQDLAVQVTPFEPVFTDYRQKHISVAALGPGDTLELHLVWVVHSPVVEGHFFFSHDFIEEGTVESERLELDVPAERQITLKTRVDVPAPAVADDRRGGRRIYRWERSGASRAPADGERRSLALSGLPAASEPAVQMTTFASWADVGRWYASLVSPQAVPSEAVRVKAAELGRGRGFDGERIEALYDYVAKSVRYISLSFGAGRYAPHAAGEVLGRQYGDCKDKHTLLAALLDAIGVKAYPLLVHTQRQIDGEIPSPSQFDHVITVVPRGFDPKHWIWLDPTLDVVPFGMLPANLRGKQALLVGGGIAIPDGVSRESFNRLVETPLDPPFVSTTDVEFEGHIDAIGVLHAGLRYALRGDGELLARLALRDAVPDQLQEFGRQVAAALRHGGDVTDVTVTDPRDTKQVLQIHYKVRRGGVLEWAKPESAVRLPLPPAMLPPVGDDKGTAASDGIDLGSPASVTIRLALDLPEAYNVRPPVDVSLTRDYASYDAGYRVSGSRLVAERRLRTIAREILVARRSDYEAFMASVRADEAQTVVVTPQVDGLPAIPPGARPGELYSAGYSAYVHGKHAAAVPLFERVVALEPRHDSAWNALGLAYWQLKRLDDAIAALDKQLHLNPFHKQAHRDLGNVLRDRRDNLAGDQRRSGVLHPPRRRRAVPRREVRERRRAPSRARTRSAKRDVSDRVPGPHAPELALRGELRCDAILDECRFTIYTPSSVTRID